MFNIGRRIEKLERKMQSIKKDADDREAKLLEIQRLEKEDNPIGAALLRLELEYGRTFSLVDMVAMAQTKGFHGANKNDKIQRKATKNNDLTKS